MILMYKQRTHSSYSKYHKIKHKCHTIKFWKKGISFKIKISFMLKNNKESYLDLRQIKKLQRRKFERDS